MKTKIIKQKNQQFLCMKLGRKEQFDVKELELLSVRAVPELLSQFDALYVGLQRQPLFRGDVITLGSTSLMLKRTTEARLPVQKRRRGGRYADGPCGRVCHSGSVPVFRRQKAAPSLARAVVL